MKTTNRVSVLVTGVGGCGVGEGIAKSLMGLPDDYRVVATNIHADAPMLFRAHARYLVPTADDPAYLESIRKICNGERIDVLIPGSEAELNVLAPLADEIRSWAVVLLANPPGVVSIGNDKWATFDFLRSHGFSTPLSEIPPFSKEFLSGMGFPVILKPRSGHASANVYSVGNARQLDILLAYFESMGIRPILQEYVGNAKEEYTASVLTGRDGEFLGSIAMRRGLMGGFSQRVEIEDFEYILEPAAAIARALGARGPVNIQCRWVEGKCQVFEINPRFSGTTPFRALAGFNEVDILIRNFLFGEVDSQPPVVRTGIVGIRGFEEHIVDRRVYDRPEGSSQA